YKLASARAVCAAAVGSGDATPESPAAGVDPRLADEAMDALRRAVIAGFRNFAGLQADDNLRALRTRGDYKELEARLGAIQKAEALGTAAGRLQAQQELLVIRRQLSDAHPDDETIRDALAAGYLAIGLLQLELGRDEATQSLARAVALREELVKAHRLSAT